ncbi:MAG: RNA polymerase sporulation sigma factor SigH [Actinobacteria bacterium HGW-Actinobacteria-10]|nr:MAG: RNA polymerase sporulation sigma factor SigH [Actinobacteria bacterium HGW-Actinobacteria-10]
MKSPGDWRGSELALVRAAQQGDQNASSELVRKYRSLVRCKARSYFLVGGDREDVIQEGMIGLYKAIRDYDPGRQSSFRSFAELCVTRQMITAIKTATRRKHSPLNGYISLSRTMSTEDEGERLLTDILAAKEICDPAEIVISAWEGDNIKRGLCEALSSFEAQVLRYYMDGHSYQEIAERLGRHAKSVDNALQRIKRKVEVQVDRCRVC